MFIKNFLEQTFEVTLKALSKINNLGKVSEELKVSVALENTVETSNPLRKLSLLAEKTWIDLLSEKKRFELSQPNKENSANIVISITSSQEGLCIKTKSIYFIKTDPTSDVGKAFKEFIDGANETINETFGKKKELIIKNELSEKSKTKQILELTKFFEEKIRKILFAVLIKKFSDEVSN